MGITGHKGRKVGRNRKKPSSQRYLISRRWIFNKVKKLEKYMKKFPNWKPTNLSSEISTKLEALLKK